LRQFALSIWGDYPEASEEPHKQRVKALPEVVFAQLFAAFVSHPAGFCASATQSLLHGHYSRAMCQCARFRLFLYWVPLAKVRLSVTTYYSSAEVAEAHWLPPRRWINKGLPQQKDRRV
jgi:hypothetical protein